MATQEKLGMVLAEDWSDDSFSSEDENEFSGAAKLFGCDAKEKLGMVPAADWSDDSYSSGDESEFSGVAKLFGCHGDRYMKPWMLAPCPAADDVYDSDSDRDMNDEEYRIYSDQVKKSDGFDVGVIPGVNMVGQIVPVPIDQKKRFYDYDLCSELAVDKNTDDISRIKGGGGCSGVHGDFAASRVGFEWILNLGLGIQQGKDRVMDLNIW